LSYI